jgi:hypothetical protein
MTDLEFANNGAIFIDEEDATTFRGNNNIKQSVTINIMLNNECINLVIASDVSYSHLQGT